MHRRSRSLWIGVAAILAVAGAVAVGVVLVATDDDDGLLVLPADGAPVEAEAGEYVRVTGTVREPDWSPLTGSEDGIAFETRNMIVAESVRAAASERTAVQPEGIDVHEREARGQRVTVVGEVADVADDGVTFVLDID